MKVGTKPPFAFSRGGGVPTQVELLTELVLLGSGLEPPRAQEVGAGTNVPTSYSG
jgi:hypothetical protein